MRRATAPRFIGLVAVTAIFCLNLFAGSASAANEQIDITGLFEFQECTAEGVELDGRVHIVTETTPNGDGTFNVTVHSNTMGVEGTGFPSGDTYRFNEGANINGEFDVIAGGVGNMVGHEEFIHPGESGGFESPGLDDKHVHFNIAVSLDALGDPVTTFIPTVECK
jgi:hypothetical protein